ncbi:50S ribosomal protein L24 [Bacteroidales bacterium OttesenSCG-928-K03]|nr:50S ribosomal protein L24 [Odoribacter sp. OttesenSCG-928-L07]MDL2242758.1 50S ribosomal protein L24 [Bacteroidales bacterium OttesenSCG-928-K03]
MKKKMHIKKGDTVIVITGESKGMRGRVLRVDYKTDKAIVEGVNMISKHERPNAKNPNGGIVKKEAPITISNLMYVDSSNKPTRIGRKVKEDGTIVRYSKKTGEEIK